MVVNLNVNSPKSSFRLFLKFFFISLLNDFSENSSFFSSKQVYLPSFKSLVIEQNHKNVETESISFKFCVLPTLFFLWRTCQQPLKILLFLHGAFLRSCASRRVLKWHCK